MWKSKLQASLQNLQSQAADSATRFRQQLMQPPAGSAPGTPAAAGGGGGPAAAQAGPAGDAGQQQYVRLPIESAKKLRWYDRQDLNMLIKLHLREKQELFEANAALRQALARRGVSEAQLEAEVVLNNAHVDRLQEEDTAVGEVLAVAAQAEVERLREEVDSLSAQLGHMRQRLVAASEAAAAQQPPQPPGRPAMPAAAAAAAAVIAAARHQQGGEPAGEERVELRLEWQPGEGGEAGRVRAELLIHSAQETAGSGSTAPGAASEAALVVLLQRLVDGGGAASDAALLQQAAIALAQLAAQQGVALPGLGPAASNGAAAGDAGHTVAASPSAAAAAAAGAAGLKERCLQLEAGSARLQSELQAAQHEIEFLKDAAERKAQEMRSRFSSQQQHLSDLLRVAQDGRLEAEARLEAAERRVQFAEARSARLDSDVRDLKAEAKRAGQEAKRFEREAQSAEARATQAEVALQKARGSVEADVRSAETISQQRARIAELEGQLAMLQRQLAAAQRQGEALEGRLAAAEMAAARANAELHDMEGVVAERDGLASRLALLEARMDETRVERSQLEAYRGVVAESEAKRARAEEELVTTAKLAAALEARLAAAQAQIDSLQLGVQAAEAARLAAVQSVAAEVTARWEAAGADRSRWPPAAQEELENLEARLAAMLTALKTAQQQAEEEAAGREAERARLAAAEQQVQEAEERLARQGREWSARERQLEAASAAATLEVGDLRRAVAELGKERDKLLEEKRARERAAQHAAAAVAAAKRRTGSGSIAESILANGSDAALTSPHRLPSAGSVGAGALPPTPAPPSPLVPLKRETLDATDLLYLKNVLLKFLDAQLGGRTQECEVLLPAVATLLRASPQEFRVLREAVQRAGGGTGVLSEWFGTSVGGTR